MSQIKENILVIQTGFLGDVVLSTPVLDELCKLFPDAQLSLLTTPGAAPMIEGHSALSEVIVYDKRNIDSGFFGLLRMASRLRKKKFTKIFTLHKSYRTALLVALVRAPQSYGFSEASLSFLYTHQSTRKEYPHEVQRNAAVLKPVGVDPNSFTTPMRLDCLAKNQEKANELLGESKRAAIALAPGSVWATKRWTVEGFAAVAAEFKKLNYSIVLIGGPDDAESGQKILELMDDSDGVLNLIGSCSLPVSAAIVSRMDLVISNDSAPLHLASATKTPVVGVFCATVPEFGFGPWQVENAVIGVDNLDCRPCGRHGGNTCPTGTHACQRELSALKVIGAAKSLLHCEQLQ